jgi:cell division protein FtsQ
MSPKLKIQIKKVLGICFWLMLCTGTIVLLSAAVSKKKSLYCKTVQIGISGPYNNIFIDEKDVREILEKINGGTVEGTPIGELRFQQMEKELEKNQWINSAEVFIDNNQLLSVKIEETEPIARVFSNKGNSFYIDKNIRIIPLSEKFSARLPVFTAFVNDSMQLKSTDSSVLMQVRDLSRCILSDPFLMAQIDQVDINKDGFEMVPKVGNHIILFGSADDYQAKFKKLKLFYKEIITRQGLNKYSKINLMYAGQIIAVKRGVEDVKMDSLRTAQIMQYILSYAQRQMNDTTGVQAEQKDDNNPAQLIPLVNDDEDLPGEIVGDNSQLRKLPVVIGKDSTKKPVVAAKPVIPAAGNLQPNKNNVAAPKGASNTKGAVTNMKPPLKKPDSIKSNKKPNTINNTQQTHTTKNTQL